VQKVGSELRPDTAKKCGDCVGKIVENRLKCGKSAKIWKIRIQQFQYVKLFEGLGSPGVLTENPRGAPQAHSILFLGTMISGTYETIVGAFFRLKGDQRRAQFTLGVNLT
jgi:hypothetical protein